MVLYFINNLKIYFYREVKRDHPEVLHSKSCYDLPVHEIAPLSRLILAACTGPQGGLTTVDLGAKPFEFPDADVYFIDEDFQDSSENLAKEGFEKLDKPDDSKQNFFSSGIDPAFFPGSIFCENSLFL